MPLVDYSRVSLLSDRQIEAWHEAEESWVDPDWQSMKHKCNTVIKRGPWTGRRCNHSAGQGTTHKGYGQCVAHGGAKQKGRAYAGALMAHQFAQELDVSPWEALLLVIRITAGRLRYIESVLAMAGSDAEIDGSLSGVETGMPTAVGPDGEVTTGRNLTWWVEKSETERDRLARVSKAAIDAGVAQLLIEKELRAGEELAGNYIKVLTAFEDAGMDAASLEVARTVMRSQLQLALEA